VTKVPQTQGVDPHTAHFEHTVEALTFIRTQMQRPAAIPDSKFVDLPASPHTKVLLLDMDETLIHCVDDITTQQPDVLLEISFEDEDEPLCAGINLRPHLSELLEQACQKFQVVVFTASH
jgi:TFIIF-interacting CTD phosphatase-like protein